MVAPRACEAEYRRVHVESGPDGLRFERIAGENHTILAVAGEIDLLTASAFDAAIDDALAATGHDLWIDLAGVTFLGSAVLHSLIRIDSVLEGTGRKAIVICPEGGPRRILRISGVERAITVVADRRSAARGSP
jgi:anti-sigma B factor antagonist